MSVEKKLYLMLDWLRADPYSEDIIPVEGYPVGPLQYAQFTHGDMLRLQFETAKDAQQMADLQNWERWDDRFIEADIDNGVLPVNVAGFRLYSTDWVFTRLDARELGYIDEQWEDVQLEDFGAEDFVTGEGAE